MAIQSKAQEQEQKQLAVQKPAKAKALAVLAKQTKAKKAKALDKLADAFNIITYLSINNGSDKLLKNKELVLSNRFLKELKSKGYDIAKTYSYNKDAVSYNEMLETVRTLCSYIKETEIVEQ